MAGAKNSFQFQLQLFGFKLSFQSLIRIQFHFVLALEMQFVSRQQNQFQFSSANHQFGRRSIAQLFTQPARNNKLAHYVDKERFFLSSLLCIAR